MTARLALIGAFLVAVSIAFASDATASHAWSKYHWGRSSNTLKLQIGDNITNTADVSWQTYLDSASSDPAANDWSDSAVLDTTIVAGSTTGLACQPKSGTVQACNANYGDTGWLGLAQIWTTRGSHIAQGAAKMNDYYWQPSVGYAYANEMMAKHVLCQEIGHTFGLGHTSEDGSSQNTCMDYYRNADDTDTTSTVPNSHDYDQLASIYKHLDRFNTASSGSAGAAAVWVAGRAADGTPLGASPARGDLYVEDLGNGRLLFTYIHWK